MSGTDDDTIPLSLNPSLSLVITWSVRRANRPLGHYRAELPRDTELVLWLLRTLQAGTSTEAAELDVEITEPVLMEAIKRGILVTPDSDPGDAPPFRCEIDPSLLDLVPEGDRASAETLARGREPLVLNPRRWLQTSNELPAELAGRLVIDSSLRDRLGYPERGPFEGVPRGLAPMSPDGRLWVEEPQTKVLQPYDLDRNMADTVARIASGTLDPRDLPAPLLSTLLLAQIVLPSRATSPEDATRRLGEMRDRLAREKYLVIHGAVSPLLVAALRRHFRALVRAGHLSADGVIPMCHRDVMYGEFTSLYLQDQLYRWLNGIVAKPIKSSYTYSARYHSGSTLTAHRDRPQCLWNVSFAIDADPEVGREGAWPLYFQVGEETRSANLGLGDAVLYSGTELLHWRDALPAGRTASLCFLHYVDADFEGPLG